MSAWVGVAAFFGGMAFAFALCAYVTWRARRLAQDAYGNRIGEAD